MTGALLRVADVSVRLGTSVILEDISVELAPGSRHVLTGHNGAGKSSLLNVISGALRPSSGRILFNDRDITAWAPHRIARAGVRRTWQHPTLCQSLTVAENVTLSASGSRTQVAQLLEQADLDQHAHQTVRQLPYGLQRRAEIAVAAACKPALLLLDEPSAGLTNAEASALVAQLRQLATHTTLLLTDHNFDFIDAIAEHHTILEQGRVIYSGTPIRGLHSKTPPPAPVNRVGTSLAPQGNPLLEVRGLQAGYRSLPVIRHADLDLRPGEIVGITGPNGAGKTTLLEAIAGLTPTAAAASILLCGQRVEDQPTFKRIQRGLGIVLQHRQIFSRLSVAENLASAATARRQAWSETGFPELQHRMTQRAGTLSGGEKQLLAVLRTLRTAPRVLLLDEPFEGLAAPAAARLHALLRNVAQAGNAVLIAEHERNLPAGLCTRRLQLRHGTVIQALTPKESQAD